MLNDRRPASDRPVIRRGGDHGRTSECTAGYIDDTGSPPPNHGEDIAVFGFARSVGMKNRLLTESIKLTIISLCLALLTAAQNLGDLDPARVERSTEQPISAILNSDGSIKRGISGSFDPTGFRIVTGRDGTPRFVADSEGKIDHTSATDCGDRWDSRFWQNGVNGSLWAIAADGGGNIYVGGTFSIAGDQSASNIAKWDGTRWFALGTGVSGGMNSTYVSDIVVSGTDVYIGGSFMTAGGTQAANIAKWNGSSWSALGSGVVFAYAIAVSGTDAYVGGAFLVAGGVVAGLGKWDGSNWSVLGETSNGGAIDIAISGTDVFVGGSFTSIGGIPANHVAKWNGSNWSALGNGTNNWVNALAVSGTDLYVGGYFTSAGGLAANGIAKWSGSTWSSLGSGLGSGTGGSAHALAVSGTEVYVGGYFTAAGGVAANGIAKWSGLGWSALGAGAGDLPYVTNVAVSGTDVYVGEWYAVPGGGGISRGIARWNGSNWGTVGSAGLGMNRSVWAISVSGSDVYVGGDFSWAGAVAANKIAKWNGSSWSALGAGVNGTVYAIAVYGIDVYVGGSFTSAGGAPANRIAKWNGSSWSALGSGVSADVYTIAVSGTDVFVGGNFARAGDILVNGIAKWNGSTWSALGSGIDGGYHYFPAVSGIAVSGADVYVGGGFAAAGGTAGTGNIAKWNGSTWEALGSGISVPCDKYGCYGGVNTLGISGSDLYVGGLLSSAGGVPVNYIAKWNGSSWSALGSETNSTVFSIGVSGTDVYFGGEFTGAGKVPANRIAKWNGSTWSALGSGTNDSVYAIGESTAGFWIGGSFTTAGCHAASGISLYNAAPSALYQLSGRVTTSAGRGISRARVTLDDGAGNVRFAITNPFGYFRFVDVPAGTYTVSVQSKIHAFTPRNISVSSSVVDLDFVALGSP